MNVGRKNKTHQAHQNKLTISVLGWQGKADPWDLLTSITNLINSRSVRGLSQKTEGSQQDSTFGKALSAQAGGAGLEPQNPCNKLAMVVYACNQSQSRGSLWLAGPPVSSLKIENQGQREALSQK